MSTTEIAKTRQAAHAADAAVQDAAAPRDKNRAARKARKGRRGAAFGTPEQPKPAATSTKQAGARRRRRKWLDKQGWYEYLASPIKSSTRQIAGLFLATSAAPTTHEGICVGKEQHTGWPYFHDPFTAYRGRVISSPNVIVLGDIGTGKSSFIKTWAVLRPLTLGRRVVVVDKKRQEKKRADGTRVAEGEYADLARALGVEPIRFVIGGGGSCINILDPLIAGETTEGSDGGASQMQLLRAVLREALGRPIKPLEGKALSIARRVAVDEARTTSRVATIRDVLRHLENPTEASAGLLPARASLDDLYLWGREAAAELERLVSEDLAGLIDGPTSADISLTAGLTVFDISALPEDGPAVAIVMAIVNTWLRAVMDAQHDTVPTVFVIEEGWHLMTGTFATITQRNQKISRGEALQNTTAMHHLSDVPPDSPAVATIKEAGTVVLYRQETLEDAKRCVELFNLPPATLATLMSLPQGTAIIKVGARKPVIVTHLRTAWEVLLTDTDSAMHSEATVALHATTLAGLGEAA